MSVPLDRLYNFLHDIVNHNIVIYRWNPHGSKKLKDLTRLTNVDSFTDITTPIMICHDQEPLDYHQYDNEFDQFSSHIGELNLPIELHNAIELYASTVNLRLVNPANIYNKTILVHSEINSGQVELYKSNNFLPVYYWSHSLIARDWFRYAQHDPMLNCHNPECTFLIYNRAWSGTREYRLKFAELVVNNGLSSRCRMGFNPIDDWKIYHNHEYKNSEFQIALTNLEQHFFKNTSLPDASADYCTQDYQATQIEVVLETLFDDSRWHLTEKALRPIACGHPFILAATPNSLAYLRSYGFETFDGLIDETYDTILDPLLRLNAIVTEMQRLTTVSQDTWIQLRDIAARNKQRFFSTEFQQQVVNEYQTNLDSAIADINQTCSGQNWNLIYAWWHHHQTTNTMHVMSQYAANYYPFEGRNSIATDCADFESINTELKILKLCHPNHLLGEYQ